MKNQSEERNITPKEFPTWKEITPNREITSAKIAIAKLKADGHRVDDNTKYMLDQVDWNENLRDSYEIVSVSVGGLFGDTKAHTYAEIEAEAQENGLDLVPASLVLSIRLNYEKKLN